MLFERKVSNQRRQLQTFLPYKASSEEVDPLALLVSNVVTSLLYKMFL